MIAARRKGRRVLFVGHDASRTGAPIMLLHLLRWLREHTDIDFDLLLCSGGPLVEHYRDLCAVFVAREPRWRGRVDVAGELLRNLFRVPPPDSPRGLLAILARRDIGLIYSNTITNGMVLAWLTALKCPVVCHAHEVAAYFATMNAKKVARIKDDASAFIAVTEETFDTLVRNGVAPGDISVVLGFLPAHSRSRDLERRRSFREQHGIPADAILVGGCGSVQWQKGPDLLVHVANAFARRASSRLIHFAWVGGTDSDSSLTQLRWDVARSNLSDRFSVIPNIPDTGAYFHSLDILALTSRNDPLPLVVMEAGVHGVPVVCFEGNAEPVDHESGRVVPYLDLELFGNAVRELAEDDKLRAKLGDRLAENIRAKHDISVAAPKIVDIIRSFLLPAVPKG